MENHTTLKILSIGFCFTLVITLMVIFVSTVVIFLSNRTAKKQKTKKSIGIVVLGDVSRSPRMMRHSLSFADHDWCVSIFAYPGSTPPKDLVQHPRINLIYLTEFPEKISSVFPRFLFVLLIGPLKAIYLSLNLGYTLIIKAKGCSYLMVQNPPAIPTLPVVQFTKFILGFKLIIDWHNTAFSILALRFKSDQHPMVRLAKWIEAKFGQYADLHLFVTRAEKLHLSKDWNLKGKKQVFYDRPPKKFSRLTVDQIHEFFTRATFNSDPALTSIYNNPEEPLPNETLITYQIDSLSPAKFKPNRPALLISSTSWTIDEDFSVLIEALSAYVKFKKHNDEDNLLPKLCCLITGKGPLRSFYLDQIRERSKLESWDRFGIRCESIWLESIQDYQHLLGCCDLGLSLHQSSSGLDLPMKIVDMFGCGLTVCARNFNCISELVQHEQNGLVFNDSNELVNQLKDLLENFQTKQEVNAGQDKLDKLRKGIQKVKYGEETQREWTDWETNWKIDVLDQLS